MRQDVSPLRRRPGTLSLDPASIFEKLLDQKTSLPPAAWWLCKEIIADFDRMPLHNLQESPESWMFMRKYPENPGFFRENPTFFLWQSFPESATIKLQRETPIAKGSYYGRIFNLHP
ncbi:hypothetical protein [uncultured Ruminococcus sp.]|uniref:hypothetical protein n=1 Tax=uncultured Ruminococcus sp. TaxID=165186 RepID=UPI002941C05A|nr:hypothetical protein [uncultured Ruminococcus sp.]